MCVLSAIGLLAAASWAPIGGAAQAPIPTLAAFAGTWYEIAGFGDEWRQRCRSDTSLTVAPSGPTRAALRIRCRTDSGIAERDGVVDARRPDGRWRRRFAPVLLAWLPVAWGDFWIVGHDPEMRWAEIGERSHTRLSVWSRTIALDEASLARAIARARREGFDVRRLSATRHTADAWRPAP
jgi:apolipoprotein D and lipocalin family protein